MREGRAATSVRLWAFLFVVGLIILWFLFLRLLAEQPPSGGPATAEPSAIRYEETYGLNA